MELQILFGSFQEISMDQYIDKKITNCQIFGITL